MRLRALELDQFRKFDRPVRIEGFGDGLNLLCGPNEMGKSTVMAALRAVLFERHRAGGEHIKALQPHGHKAAPWVALDFDLDGETYRIEKRFLRNEQARLHLPGGRRFEGAAAEEELQRLLGFTEPGPRGVSPEQLGAWSVLWASQGASFGQAEMVERARRSLEGALGAEVGALLGTDEACEIRRAVDLARRELVDGHGRPKGRHKDAIERIERLTQQREQLRQARVRLAGDIQQLEAAQRRLAELLDQREEARLLAQRDQARRRQEELSALQERIRSGEAECALATQKERGLRQEIERRARIAAAIEDLRRRLAEATGGEIAARHALEQSEREIAQLHVRHGELEERRAVAGRTRDRLRRLQSFLHDLERLQHLQAQARQVREAAARAQSLRLQAEAIAIGEAEIEALRISARERERAEAALQAVATAVRFAIDAAALGSVRVDGAPLVESLSERQAVRPVVIEIAGVGAITVAPQIAERERLLAARDEATRRLCDLLAEAGVDRIEAAEAWLREKQRLQVEAGLAERQAQGAARLALPEVDGPNALRDEIERRLARVESERVALQIGTPPHQNEVGAELVAIEDEIAGLDQSLREEAAALEGLRQRRERHLAEQGRTGEVARRGAADLEARAQELELAERERPGATLDPALRAAVAELAEQRRVLAALREQASGGTPHLVESEIGRLDQAIERRRADIGDLRESIAARRSSIEKDEGAGLEEQIEDVGRRLELAERERAACEREVKALLLLLGTLDAAETAAKERYLAPFVSRLRPYLCGLFPDAEVSVDDAFCITAIRRPATGEERFDQLSDGTREQIAVLARLAFADLLADQGLAVVVLDDALAFSDDRRLEQMFDVLHHAARRLQIVVFTCRERLFENLAATRLRLVEVTRDAAAAD